MSAGVSEDEDGEFIEFYWNTYTMLRGAAVRMVRPFHFNEHDGEEALCDAYATLLVKWRKSGSPENPTGWMYRALTNLLLNKSRIGGKFVGPVAPLEEVENADIRLRHFNESAEHFALFHEFEANLLEAIGLLPRRQMMIVTLKASEFTDGEIAEVLGISEGAVRVSLSKARKSLRSARGEL